MLTLRAPGVALALALVASVALAQSGEADPPGAGPVPGKDGSGSTPKRVLTLEEKRRLVEFCTQAGNRHRTECQGIALPTAPDEPIQDS